MLYIYVIFIYLFTSSDSLFVPVSKLLTKNKPHKLNIFNKDIVLWWNKKIWSATDDMCLHRQGSLSKGLITKEGNIKCGYHGLEYNNCGKCTYLPSSEQKMDLQLESYDIVEKHNMLWLTNEQNITNNLISNLLRNHFMLNWFLVDLDIKPEFIIENSLDSLHFSHVHHNILPSVNRNNPLPIINKGDCQIVWFNETGFSYKMSAATFTFIAPFTITFTIYDFFTVCGFVLPISAEKTRFITNLFIPCKNPHIRKFFNGLVSIFNPILNKMSSYIFNQDVEQILSQQYYVKKYNKKYISNYAADKPIQLYNNWVSKYNSSTVLDI